MAEYAAKRTVSGVDPMFFVPEGMEEIVYDDNIEDPEAPVDEESEDELTSDEYLTNETEDNNSEAPDTPDVLGVLQQIVKTGSSGAQVVDVIIEVEDIPGISNYEFRVTKL